MDRWPHKDPADVLDYDMDWTAKMGDGETITDADWSVDLATLTLGASSIAGARTKVWLSGGVPPAPGQGQQYVVTCHVVTSAGRQWDRSALIFVTER